jgi:hypothetical protein
LLAPKENLTRKQQPFEEDEPWNPFVSCCPLF